MRMPMNFRDIPTRPRSVIPDNEKPSLEQDDQPEPSPNDPTPAPRSRIVLNPRPVRVRVESPEQIG